MKEVTVNELFSGIGTQALALEYENIPHRVVGMCEISEPAIKAYNCLHGETRNYGDISSVARLDYADFWTYSFPCQDLSAGGKGAGMVEGTRSGLLWQVERLLEVAVKEGTAPKYLMLENVPDIAKAKHIKHFKKWLNKLEELGYYNFYKVLEGCNYGAPQLRRRMYVVSIRKDLKKGIVFEDTNGIVPMCLEDVDRVRVVHCMHSIRTFDDYVDESVREYKGPLMIDPRVAPSVRKNYERDLEQIAYTAQHNKDFVNMYVCDCESGFQDNQVGIRVCPTLRHQNSHACIFYNNQIHKLTAREAWKFMGIKAEDFDKVKEETKLGDNTLYGLAGNAIVVDVLRAIFSALLEEGVDYER